MQNAVRIIGGKWRGRKLRFPPVTDLRPTLGRVRETLFNWLRTDLYGATCLDLFAGTGALGFEAESQGAKSVDIVEADRAVVQALRLAASGMQSQAKIVHASATDYLAQARTPWDLVFLDPPYQTHQLGEMLQKLRSANLVSSYVYYECHHKSVQSWPGWQSHRSAKAGETGYGLLIPEK